MSILEGRRRTFGKSFPSKPVEQGKEYEVDIKEVSQRGDGVARVKGFVVFVPGTKPGDHVKVRITNVAKRFAVGEVI
ncbi:MAG: TRAM domain-containing protein [Candidatus Methanomethylicia archaeon]